MELRGVGRDRQGGLYSAFCIQSVHLLLGNRTLNSDLIVLQNAVRCADLIGGAINNTVVDRIDTIELPNVPAPWAGAYLLWGHGTPAFRLRQTPLHVH